MGHKPGERNALRGGDYKKDHANPKKRKYQGVGKKERVLPDILVYDVLHNVVG